MIRIVKQLKKWEEEQAKPKPELPASGDSSIEDEEDDYQWVKIAE
jgi:hypothetical protein